MNKQTIIKHAEIASAYCEAFGYFPDEIVGASAEEMRIELIESGYSVEEIPAPAQRPMPSRMTAEEAEIASRFFTAI